MYDFSRIYSVYPSIVSMMPEIFTSHEFILKLAHEHQALYIEALYAYRQHDSNNPFQIVHGVLAQRLLAEKNLIEHLGGVSSHDIFGQPNGCGNWRKLPIV